MLDMKITEELRQIQGALDRNGELLSQSQLTTYCDTFRRNFGPDRLQTLDGEALLERMHDHSSKESLVYWLEFKDDDEFPDRFGGIGGGSALKFGVYRRKETGAWMAGPPQAQSELSVNEAIERARQHRDELIKGAELLERLGTDATDTAYGRLQKDLEKAAPIVSGTAWAHKYFCILYPDRLDDYHNPEYQRFHLIRLLQAPLQGDGRYIAAGRYVAIAKELGLLMNNLTRILNSRTIRPYRYWRIGTSDGTEPQNRWQFMKDGNCVGIGWDQLGNLSSITYDEESKEKVRDLLQSHYPDKPPVIGRATQQVFNFVAAVSDGDLVLASDGQKVLGVGKVVGQYYFDQSPGAPDFPHRRHVKWLNLDRWSLPTPEGVRTTLHRIAKDPANLVEIETRILGARPDMPTPVHLGTLAGIQLRIQSVLQRKGQVILYGPPGTGKTYWAMRTARDLAALSAFGTMFDQLGSDERTQMEGDGAKSKGCVRTCCFHSSYGYEDFLEGYRPEVSNGQMVFKPRDGIFKELCRDARAESQKEFYLIIDEINRGEVPRIFGELLTILELDKRDKPIVLPLSNELFSVPKNVRIIATMNTADRSIALLDTALRRRFGFIEVMPDLSIIGDVVVEGIPLRLWLRELNQRICKLLGHDARNRQIGHTYLLQEGHPIRDFTVFAKAVQQDLIPLLEEYCYEDYGTLAKILGSGLVNEEEQRVKHELFETSAREQLVNALKATCPDIETSMPATASGAAGLDEENEDGEA